MHINLCQVRPEVGGPSVVVVDHMLSPLRDNAKMMTSMISSMTIYADDGLVGPYHQEQCLDPDTRMPNVEEKQHFVQIQMSLMFNYQERPLASLRTLLKNLTRDLF
jgi:hypothetical protein